MLVVFIISIVLKVSDNNMIHNSPPPVDVRTGYMTDAIDSTTAAQTPGNEVDALISQVGDAHALDTAGMFKDTAFGDPLMQPAAKQAEAAPAEDDLTKRMAALRGQ